MWIFFALLAALLAAIVVTLSKAGIKNVDSSLGFAIQSILILIVAWGVVFWQGNFKDVLKIEKQAWLYLVTAGILTCISSLCTFYALKIGDASRVSPLERISLVFAIFLAAIFLKERLSWQLLVGAALMGIGAIIIAFSGNSAK
jgi:transporter family protein